VEKLTLTLEQFKAIQQHAKDATAEKDVCCLCGGAQDRVSIFKLFSTRRPGRKIWIMPLCKKCAEDPELHTRLIEREFMQDVGAL